MRRVEPWGERAQKRSRERLADIQNDPWLQRHLSEKQKKDYVECARIIVKGSSGSLFSIPVASGSDTRYYDEPVHVFDDGGFYEKSIGIGIKDGGGHYMRPKYNLLGLKLAIEEDESEIFDIACSEHYDYYDLDKEDLL